MRAGRREGLVGGDAAPAQAARFVVVGGVLALANWALLALLIDSVGVGVVAACAVSFVVLNGVGYGAHKVFSFGQAPRPQGAELLRYYAVMALSLALNLGAMALLVERLGWHWWPASVLVTAGLTGLNFLAHRHHTFRASASADAVATATTAVAGTAAAAAAPVGVADDPVVAAPAGQASAVDDATRARPPARVPDDAPRLLQVSAFFAAHGGGIEAVAAQLATRAPSRLGVRVHWMAGGAAGERPTAAVPGLTVEHARSSDPLERRTGLPAPLWGPRSLWRLWRAVGRADLVHVHDVLYQPTLAALAFAALRRRPTVVTQHIGDIPLTSPRARALLALLNRRLVAPVLARADQVVFVGRPVLAHFAALTAFRCPPLLLPNGVDHARFAPVADGSSSDGGGSGGGGDGGDGDGDGDESANGSRGNEDSDSGAGSRGHGSEPVCGHGGGGRDGHGSRSDGPGIAADSTPPSAAADHAVRLLFVGRFVDKKGIALLRHSLALPRTAWRLVGWGPLDPAAWPETATARCEVLGRLPPDRVAACLREADLLVLPSTGEGFPLVVQEALACGTPVLVSTEVFEAFPAVDERCVFHVELRRGDAAAALRERLRRLLDDPAALRRARAPAAALARQWDWDACVDGYGEVYRRCLRRTA